MAPPATADVLGPGRPGRAAELAAGMRRAAEPAGTALLAASPGALAELVRPERGAAAA